ncbi:hypothetical protein, partial [Faecalibaculum rodentium]|uniref:hypothetical protein n=1 Tax=Faecalibaculum rodentium TaxID=1702221 RepID=UPI0025A9DA1B
LLRGSPPRMRGQVLSLTTRALPWWITPADAGTSHSPGQPVLQSGDHPRGCGDKLEQSIGGIETLGSPPRMRGQV